MYHACILLLIALSVNAVGGGIAMAGVVIAERGKSDYSIVIAKDAIPSERYAAEELQRYIERISGAKLPIVTDEQPMRKREIMLGENGHTKKLRIKLDTKKFGTDGFIIRTVGESLVIVGGKPRGTLYGVYALLEEKFGVRWFAPDVEHVPKFDRLELPSLNEMQLPAFEYREVFWTEMMRDADFAARHRLNGQHYRLTEKHGGRAVVFYPFVHSFDALIPRELFKEHPEYFPLIGGKRVSGYVQRCLSNPNVLKLAIEKVRQWIKEHPEATIIDVSQNDTGNWCQCENCKALDDSEGSPSASIIRFVNAIAEAVEKEYPHIRIETLAYTYSRKPPRTLRPRHNVIIRLCSIECCFSHPLDGCPSPENKRFVEDTKAWQKVAPILYVWDYTTNFAHYIQPFPNLDVLQANVQFFSKHGVVGLFEQGNYSPGGNGEMAPLRSYLLAKLLWNPNTDIKRHMDEFLNGYYGSAAKPIRAYIELLHSRVREKGYHAHIYDAPTAPYINDDEFLNAAEKLFDEAENIAADDSIRFRVQVARLPIWYVKLATNRVKGEEKQKLLGRFLEIARKAGVTHISEGRGLDAWAKQMGAM
ncbi:MAG: DUF4838 domain-containing protein [Armatimonadota bacterium]|nr:DUF4838 domain-containing protein [Armatimonadota bacterium]MCX7776683.1 DUF4838 domain-containing protein [Armatimonadota bacterium]MDW8025702.1 DUF4838 domain-containing protein [Armatimonadota bacterium]